MSSAKYKKELRKPMKQLTLLGAVALCLFTGGTAFPALVQSSTTTTTTTTTVTSVTGTITELNYGNGGEVQGFLTGTDVLLSFPSSICGGVSTLGVVGNSVTYSGTAITASSGFESVQVSSFTNNTTKATYTAPTSGSTTYGPTSGTIKQLNYAGDGSINGFLFTASSTSIFVSIGYTSNTTLSSLLTVGATVSVTGTTSPSMSACSSTGAIESVNASSLTIGSTTVVIQTGGFGGPGPGGLGGGHGPH
jgi:hypothetical protein